MPGPDARVEGPQPADVTRAYLDWATEPDLAAGEATGVPAGPIAVTRPDEAAGGVTQPGNEGEAGGGGPAPSRPLWVLVAVAVTVVALDVVTKIIVVVKLSGRAPVTVIPHVLDLELTRNPGAAFSVGTSWTAVYSLLAIVVVVVIGRTARRLRSVGWAVALGAIVSGAVGNLIDRLVRAPGPLRGYVVDWIHLTHWPIFNVADSAISCGAVLAVLLSAMGIGLDGRRAAGPAATADPAGSATARTEPAGQD